MGRRGRRRRLGRRGRVRRAYPLAPNANYSLAGLVPLIGGGEVVALTADRASIRRRQGATLTYLRRPMIGAVAIWDLALAAA